MIDRINVTVAAFSDAPNAQNGVLTTEHAASSYGLLVLLIDGQPHGPADLPEHVYLWLRHEAPWPTVADYVELEERIIRAGYRLGQRMAVRDD